MYRIRSLGAGLLFTAAVLMHGCGKNEPPPTPKPDSSSAPQEMVVKIGHAAPLTGGIAHQGKDNENGARLAVEEANKTGVSIDGKKIRFQLLAEDDEEKPDKGPIIAQKFVDAKVAGVVGHLNSGVTIPASDVYSKAGIPMISGSATAVDVTERKLPGVFRVVGRDDQQGPAIASYLASEFKPKVVALVDDSTAYGEGLANQVEKTLVAAGVKVLPREKGSKDSRDWKAILTKLKGKKPDAVFYGGMDATAGPLLKQGRELGIKVVFAFGDGACTNTMNTLASGAAEGLVCSQAGIPVQAASRKFLDAYKARFNADPIQYSPFTYDSANVLIEAMKRANSTEPAKYLPELTRISYQGVTGKIEFDEKGDRKDAEMTIFMMKSGQIEPLAIVKSGKTIPYADFIKATATPGADAPAEPVQK